MHIKGVFLQMCNVIPVYRLCSERKVVLPSCA